MPLCFDFAITIVYLRSFQKENQDILTVYHMNIIKAPFGIPFAF